MISFTRRRISIEGSSNCKPLPLKCLLLETGWHFDDPGLLRRIGRGSRCRHRHRRGGGGGRSRRRRHLGNARRFGHHARRDALGKILLSTHYWFHLIWSKFSRYLMEMWRQFGKSPVGYGGSPFQPSAGAATCPLVTFRKISRPCMDPSGALPVNSFMGAQPPKPEVSIFNSAPHNSRPSASPSLLRPCISPNPDLPAPARGY